MGKLPTETSTHFAIAGTDDREDIIDEMNEHQLLSNASPRNNDRAKKRSNKRPKNIDRFTMADVTSASLTPTSYGNKGKGKRRLHRLENVRYLLSFWDKEKDEDEVFEEEPLQTIFTQVVTDDDARKVWNEFAALSGEEQDDYLAFIEQSERRRKQWTNLGRACRVSNPAFRSDVIDTTVSDTASDASPELSANHCYQRIERHLRSALTKNHVPLGMLEKLEQELSSFFEKWPSSKYVSVLSSSYERLLLHALCQYLGLLSHSITRKGSRCTEVINGDRHHFVPPSMPLSKYLRERQ